MLNVQISLYAMAICLSVFTCIFLYQAKLNFPKRFFVAFLFIQASASAFEWLMANPETPYKGLWLLGIMLLALLLAPCLWLFARDIMAKKQSNSPIHILKHLLPIILGTVLLIPLALSIHAGSAFDNNLEPISSAKAEFILTSMFLMASVFFLQSLVYSTLCTRLIKYRLLENKQLFAHTSDASIKILRILLIVVIGNFVTNALRVLYCWALDEISLINLLFAGIQITLIAYLCFSVLLHSSDENAKEDSFRKLVFECNTDNLEDESLLSSKYKHSALDKERRANILNAIDSLFTQEKYYRDSQLSLNALCSKLGDLPYLVSQAINESQHRNFYNLVNNYRINEAKELLLTQPMETILEIAYSVGYNSKSTFNTAFKNRTGMTPSMYRQENSGDKNRKVLC